MRLKLLQACDPVLRAQARRLTHEEIITDEIQRLIRDMREAMQGAPAGRPRGASRWRVAASRSDRGLVLRKKSVAQEFFAHPLRRYLLESVFVMQTAQNGASLLLDDYAEYGDLNVAALECLLRVPESLGPVAKIGCVARTRDRTATLGRSWLNCGDRRSSSGVISHLR